MKLLCRQKRNYSSLDASNPRTVLTTTSVYETVTAVQGKGPSRNEEKQFAESTTGPYGENRTKSKTFYFIGNLIKQ